MSDAKYTPDFDDDYFPIGNGPMRQCISGYANNAVERICNRAVGGTRVRETVSECFSELVSWCRAFNRELHDAKELNADLLAACKAFAKAMRAKEQPELLDLIEALALTDAAIQRAEPEVK